MRAPFLPPDADGALDTACRDVEGEVSRLAKLVLHASALADRMEAPAMADPPGRPGHSDHVRVLRQAAEAGRRAISQAGHAARSGRPHLIEVDADVRVEVSARPERRVASGVPFVGPQRRR